MNPIEQRAATYLSTHLPTYQQLTRELDEQASATTSKCEKDFFSCLAKYRYIVFENLHFLHEQSAKPAGGVRTLLPIFMSVEIMAFPTEEYLRRMMCLMELAPPRELTKNKFCQILAKKKIGTELRDVEAFLTRAAAFPSGGGLRAAWDRFSGDNELRHTLTHKFRLPWWKNGKHPPYGFAASTLHDWNAMKDDLWRFVTDPKAYEAAIEMLPAGDFVSGQSVLEEIHTRGAVAADSIFKVMLEDKQVIS